MNLDQFADDYWLVCRRTGIGTFEYFTGHGWTPYPDAALHYAEVGIDFARQLGGDLLHVLIVDQED